MFICTCTYTWLVNRRGTIWTRNVLREKRGKKKGEPMCWEIEPKICFFYNCIYFYIILNKLSCQRRKGDYLGAEREQQEGGETNKRWRDEYGVCVCVQAHTQIYINVWNCHTEIHYSVHQLKMILISKVNRKQSKDFYWLDTNLNPRFEMNARAGIVLTHGELWVWTIIP